MWKPNVLVETLERTCDLKSPPEVGKWYAVPTYPMEPKVLHIPVYLPAHEDKKAFNFSVWHYHIDARFLHDNALAYLLRQRGISRKYYTKYLYIAPDSRYMEYATRLYSGVAVMPAWEFGFTDREAIFESWYGYYVDNFPLIVTETLEGRGKSADYSKIRWKAEPCRRVSQKPSLPSLHNVLSRIENYKKVREYCGRCPHKGINLDAVEAENGIKVCPAHGGRWKVDNKKISIMPEVKI